MRGNEFMRMVNSSWRGWHRNLLLIILGFLLCAAPGVAQRGRRGMKQGGFRFRFVGPEQGNRVASIAGVAGDPSTYYAGAASGGVWKSADGGNRWLPIFDKEPVAAIGALAVAPSDPNVVWVGTGEAWAIRDSDVMGNGVYKSTDAGKTWTHTGLDRTGRIGRIVIDPRNPETAFVCALGRTTGPQPERGVFRTTDGGAHWDRVLFADENTGCSGLAMDPHNSRVLFAGMWQVEMHTWGEFSGGPGSGLYVSRDGGNTWTRIIGHGLPKSPQGKIDVAVAPTDSNRVYALIQTKDQGSVWRSDDAGESWRAVNYDRRLIGRAGYYVRIAVSTGNENEVYVANSSFFQSLDGGLNFHGVPWGGDTHDIWVDPRNPDRFVVTDDAGLIITTVHGRGFHRVSLPIGQMYHVAVDNQIPYDVYSNMQDDGNMRGPNNSLMGWDHEMGGCESGFTVPDPTNPDIVWATCYGDEVTVWNAKTKLARSVSPWLHTLDSPPNNAKYRCHWTPPLAIDPFDHNTVYYGCQVIFKTSNGGQSWSVISPDLSTHNPSRMVSSGGLEGDNLGQFYGEVVFAIAPSQIKKGLIWAGTDDGQVWTTRDGGDHWTNVTRNITGMPAWGTVTSIEPSPFDPGTAYVSVDFHLMDNRDPFIYKTTDFGQTWTSISGGLPKNELSYVRIIAEDPNCKGLLFAGTGDALYDSLDDGGHWTPLQEGLPHAPVTGAVVEKRFHDLVVSTYGRGLYILDDITPLEQMAQHPSDAPVRFFAPRPAYRFFHKGRGLLNYSVKSAPKAPVQIEIVDSSGNVIRKLHDTAKPGMNRAAWDLRYEPPRLIKLRTDAPGNPHIWDEPRFRGKDFRPVTHWGIEPAEVGPLAPSGNYTVRLTVNAQTFSQPFTILHDPRASGTHADIEASVKLQLRITHDISNVSDMVNQIEWMRKQLHDVAKMLRGQKDKADLLKSVEAMNQKMLAVETKLVAREQLNSDDKYFAEAYKPYLNLIWLNGEVGTGAGDVAGSANYAPTDTDVKLLQMIEKDLAAAQADYRALIEKEVPAFNRSLAGQGITPLVAAYPVPSPVAMRRP
ncbi:MAG: WD40/YVTN/BNR-like repeat-containing protein [Terriglobia bacterium]